MEELKNYQITFKKVFLMATSPEDAESKAEVLINNGEIEVSDVYEM
jgi:hypothetical protein